MTKVAQIITTQTDQCTLEETLTDYQTSNDPTQQQIKVWNQKTKIKIKVAAKMVFRQSRSDLAHPETM